MKELRLDVISPDKEIFNGEVKSVTLPGTIGSFTILPRHAPVVSSLVAGRLVYLMPDGEEHALDIKGGFIEMNGNKVSVCID